MREMASDGHDQDLHGILPENEFSALSFPGGIFPRGETVMSLRLFEIIAALIAGVVALAVLKIIGLVIKLALIFALIITLAAWLVARAISARFTSRN